MSVKLKKFLLRYYPPGLIIDYERDGSLKQKTIDLLDIIDETDLDGLITRLIQQVSLSRSTYIFRIFWRDFSL